MPSLRSGLIGLAALAALAGCNDGPTGPTYVSRADSAALAYFGGAGEEMLLQELSLLNSQFPLSGGVMAPYDRADAGRVGKEYLHQVLAGWARQGIPVPAALLTSPSFSSPYSECTPTITGVDSNGFAIDSDEDGIPDDYNLDYGTSCVSEDSAGTLRVTLSGSFRLQDTDLGFFSYRVTIDHNTGKIENLVTGETTSGTGNGFEIGVFTAGNAHRVLSLAVTSKTVAGEIIYQEGNDFVRVADFTPDTGHVLTMGGALPAGTIEYSADHRQVNVFDGQNYYFYLRTPTPLHFDPACGSDFDAGTLRGALNRNEAIGFQFSWTGCSAPAFEVFGETPAAAPKS